MNSYDYQGNALVNLFQRADPNKRYRLDYCGRSTGRSQYYQAVKEMAVRRRDLAESRVTQDRSSS